MNAARKTLTSLSVTALLGAIACSGARPPIASNSFDIQGHRGARGLAPENTLAAFARAIELGVTTLELDVAVTRDGAVVVAHDPFVSPSRCLTAAGAAVDAKDPPLFRDLTLEQVKGYDCGSLPPDDARFPSPPWTGSPGEAIPTLGEVFELARNRGAANLAFNIETKVDPSDTRTRPVEEFVAAVVDVVRRNQMTDRTTLQSFDWRALVIADVLEPRLQIAALVDADAASIDWHAGIPGETLDALRQLDVQVDILSPAWKLLTDASSPGHIDIRVAHELRWCVIPWTVNTPSAMAELIELGVDGFITDYPDVAIKVARERRLIPTSCR